MLAGLWAPRADAIPAAYSTLLPTERESSPLSFAFTTSDAPAAHRRIAIRSAQWGGCGIGILDNLDELKRELGLAAAVEIDRVLGVAIERWQANLFERLRGDWVLALWHSRRREGYFACDALGLLPLYQARLGWGLAFSTDIGWLLRLPDVSAELNRERVACLLANLEPDPTSTYYAGIERVPGGHSVAVSGARAELNRYWSLADAQVGSRPSTLQDYSEAYSERFRVSVRRCTNAGSGLMLSGGMDSSAIVGVASSQRRPIRTYTARSSRFPSCDESEFVLETTARHGITPKWVDLDDTSTCPAPPELAAKTHEPHHLVWCAIAWRLCAAAQLDGVSQVVTGAFGDCTGGTGRFMLSELASRRTMAWAIRELVVRPRLMSRALASSALELASPAAHARVRRALRGTLSALEYLDPDFVREQSLLERARAARSRRRAGSPVVQLLKSSWIDLEAGNVRWCAAQHGIASRFPFLDRDLVQLAVRLPPEMRLRAGFGRWVLRQAVRDAIPAAVLERRDKTSYSPVFAAQARVWLRQLDPAGIDGSIFNAKKLIADVNRSAATHIELHRLWTCGAVIEWMRGKPAPEKSEASVRKPTSLLA